MEALEKDELSQKKVLIVDHEATSRGNLRSSVESLGYLCTEADSAHTALELLKRTHFPIIISDVTMPEMDGLELLHIIKKRYSDVSVLIVTEQEGTYSPMKIVEAGASDFLAKPFTMDELAAQLYKIEREKALKNKLYLSSVTDQLTGLYNRRYFYQKLKREMDRAKRQGYPMSMIMVDVEGFKKYNDRYHHLKGDALLETVAWVLRSSLRGNLDCAFRYGADEFVVVLPEADGKTALSIGNRIKAKFKDKAPHGLSLSMGAAEFQKDFDTETFVGLVDERMFRDKQKPEEPGQSQSEVGLGKDNHSIRCLSCGTLVRRAPSICENRLADLRKRTGSEKGQNIGEKVLKKPPRSGKDRRKSPRVNIRKTFLHDGLQATIQNISREGIQIKTKTPLCVGEAFTIALALENTIVRFGGVIVYVRSLSDGNSLAGLRFLEISDEDTRTLNCFLDSRLFLNGEE